MENNKEIEKDRESTMAASADKESMVIDTKGEVGKEREAGGEDDDLVDDLGNRSMDVEDERPVKGKDEQLGSSRDQSMEVENENLVEAKHKDMGSSEKQRMDAEGERPTKKKDGKSAPSNKDEKGKKPVDAELNKGRDGNKSFTDMENLSVEEKGSIENLPANESASGGYLVPKNQLEDSVEAGEKAEKSKELSNGLTTEKLFVKNGAKEEDLKNEAEKAKVEDPKKRVTVGQSVAYDGTKEQQPAQVKEALKPEPDTRREADVKTPIKSFLYDSDADGYESGTEEEQALFMKELETFHRERGLDFKPPKFYQEKLNLLKLWRSVIKLGGYEQVTSCKLWRQVGESFKPPKTCTTVSWTFRGFYEKSLLEYEKHKILSGELPEIDATLPGSVSAGTQAGLSQGSGSGRARRDAAARAMQGWHSMRLLSNGEVGDPIIKDKNPISLGKREKQLKSIGLLKRRKESPIEHAKIGHLKPSKPQSDSMVVDLGPPADWVKINVQRTKDCFEVYALVPGLLREEVRVQSDPAGRLVISGQPEQLDNPWGVTPFKKVVTLPSRIDPHQTSAVVTLHGQLFVRVPFEQSDT